MNPNLRSAIYQMLIGNSTLLGMLPNGTNGIYSTQRLKQGDALPAIVLVETETPSTPRLYPFSETRFNLDVYDSSLAYDTASFVQIDSIIEEAINTLHRKPITVNMSYYGVFEIFYDNYQSRDLWDPFLNLPHRFARFCVYGTHLRYEPSGY